MSEKQVRKEIDDGIVVPATREPLRLSLSALVYINVIGHIGFDVMALKGRERLLHKIVAAFASNETTVLVYDVLELRIDRVVNQIEKRRNDLASWRKERVVSDSAIVAGEEKIRSPLRERS